jgi:uncharacterized protein YukJ
MAEYTDQSLGVVAMQMPVLITDENGEPLSDARRAEPPAPSIA